jgi:AraC-like DNA-binding protein
MADGNREAYTPPLPPFPSRSGAGYGQGPAYEHGLGQALGSAYEAGSAHAFGPGPGHGSTAAPKWPASPILTIGHGEAAGFEKITAHAHPEPMLMWTSTATVTATVGARDWLVPPGYGMWVPGGVEHAASVLHAGEISVVVFAPDACPIRWTEPTGIAVGPLLRELFAHLARTGPADPSRPHAEALLFALLTPLPTHDIHVSMPSDPRIRVIAEQLVADPADPRELAVWAHQVNAGVRTLSRLFRAETGLSFTRWRTKVRVRAAIRLLAEGTTVHATARAVGYRKPSAFIDAFRRATGQTPGTYVPVEGAAPAPGARADTGGDIGAGAGAGSGTGSGLRTGTQRKFPTARTGEPADSAHG